jgi:serine protease Do
LPWHHSAKFIQTDAAINGGTAATLAEFQGQVVGIASRILSVSGGFQGIGFVVPINTAKALISFKDRFWLGIEGIYLNEEGVARLLNRELKGGLLIERVAKGSPADKAGLKGGSVQARMLGRDFVLGGDLVISFGEEEACTSECLVDASKRFGASDRLPVTFVRGGVIMQTTIDLSLSRRDFLIRMSRLDVRRNWIRVSFMVRYLHDRMMAFCWFLFGGEENWTL